MLSCPSHRATLRMSPVACSVFKAQVWRQTCGDTRLVFSEGHLSAAAGKCFSRICLKPERVRGWAHQECPASPLAWDWAPKGCWFFETEWPAIDGVFPMTMGHGIRGSAWTI